ncbi:MAG: hypothetical protein E6R03_03405 [Hyphomicrobiaceae bacterium]|nr:MAG: hypothetical protein E6R03_03405 [Hyphomicrobiaceae bacterium]
MKVQFADWTIGVSVGENGELTMVVDHPVNGSQRQVEIHVDRRLGIIHDSHWTIEDRLEQEALLQEWTVQRLQMELALDKLLEAVRQDAMLAQDILHRLQGYRHEWNVPFGQMSRWERNGVVCNAPSPVPHAMAYHIIKDVITKATTESD